MNTLIHRQTYKLTWRAKPKYYTNGKNWLVHIGGLGQHIISQYMNLQNSGAILHRVLLFTRIQLN